LDGGRRASGSRKGDECRYDVKWPGCVTSTGAASTFVKMPMMIYRRSWTRKRVKMLLMLLMKPYKKLRKND